ncbi:MAG: hypothetical protein GKR91_08700 [Pseudomonadales bacterium]|nr:hypothetical protein [Pseudomonadales bacterium]
MSASSQSLISLPVAVLTKQSFRYQASLFWYSHRTVYGDDAFHRARILWVEKNLESEAHPTDITWLDDMGAPYTVTKPFYEFYACPSLGVNVPLNIQAAVAQVIDDYEPEQLLEILDCDMLHLRPAPTMELGDDEIYVDSVYEDWHLKSLGECREIISPYFKNNGAYYNGGFVPIIGKAKTLKKLLDSWAQIHIEIVNSDIADRLKWWAGMYALQAACENCQVEMKDINGTFIPGKNELRDSHYIAHYSVDKVFDKKKRGWPFLNKADFPNNIYYDRIIRWLDSQPKSEDPATDMEDKWRHWIAKCLMMEHPEEAIAASLVEKGYAKDLVAEEIARAKENPYFKGASEVFQRETAKLEDQSHEEWKASNNQAWLLGVYEKLSRLDESFGEIERISPPPFKEFVANYLSKNRPVILSGAMEEWPAYQKWSLDYFRQCHGNSVVSIQDGREGDPHYERNQKFHRSETKFAKFLDRLESTESSNDFYMTAGNMSEHRDSLAKIFADCESLNIGDGYLEGQPDGSLWIGPRGTITPLHFDMINNLFCQIVGRKRVRMVPSWSMPWVYNDYHVYSDVDAAEPDLAIHPLFENATVYDFVINPGELLFIPVGWWHHLESLDITISLTRKNLAARVGSAFGTGFIRESQNFQIGQVD